MQAVILAGGLGTRLRPLTDSLPKPMIPIHGRPFLEFELSLLAKSGIKEAVLCVGYRGETVEGYFGSGEGVGVHIQYSWDGGELLGPIGALKKAQPLLRDSFIVVYGDAYLRLAYRALMQVLLSSESLAVMAVMRNRDRYGRSDLMVRDGLVVAYDKNGSRPGMEWVNFGATALRKRALDLVPPSEFCDEETFYRQLITARQLLAYQVYDRFFEIGSRPGMRQFEDFAASIHWQSPVERKR